MKFFEKYAAVVNGDVSQSSNRFTVTSQSSVFFIDRRNNALDNKL